MCTPARTDVCPAAPWRRRRFLRAKRTWLLLWIAGGCADAPSGSAPSPANTAEQVASDAAPVRGVDDLRCGFRAEASNRYVLDVGHGDPVEVVARAGSRAVTQDRSRWVLWDLTAQRSLASGPIAARDAALRVDIAEDVVVTPGAQALEVRSARDGGMLVRIALDARPLLASGVAPDGSHVYAVSDGALRLWDRTGRLLNQLAGSFAADTRVVAVPGALRVGGGADGTVVTLPVRGAAITSPPHAGVFHAWFLDGAHFVTRTDDGFDVHRADGTRVQRLPFASDPATRRRTSDAAGGDGAFVWTADAVTQTVRVHRLGAEVAAETFAGRPLRGLRSRRATFLTERDGLRVLDARGSEPQWREAEKPMGVLPTLSADAEGQWVLGELHGRVYAPAVTGAPPAVLSCGRIFGLSAAGDRVAIGTADRRVRIYDLGSGKPVLVRVLDDQPMRDLAFADGGRYLVLHRRSETLDLDDRGIRVLDATSGALVHEWPELVTSATLGPTQIGLLAAARADRLARIRCVRQAGLACTVHVAKVDGTELLEAPASAAGNLLNGMIALSPDGTRLAAVEERADPANPQVLVHAVGEPSGVIAVANRVAWVDDQRLLIGRVQDLGGGAATRTSDLELIGADGMPIKTLRAAGSIEWARDDAIDYVVLGFSVLRIADGVVVWSALQRLGRQALTNPLGVVAKKKVIFASNHEVVMDPLP